MEEEYTPKADRNIDLESLKALAHPLRVQIVDVLAQYGPHTASGLAARLGESSGATSYHLRQLAKHDFVREIVGRGTSRERWWERTPGGLNLDARTLADTEAARAAATMVVRQWQQTREQQLNAFLDRGLDVLPGAWMDASVISTSNVRVTAEQLHEFTEQWQRHVDAFAEKHRGQNPTGSRPVQIQFNAFPLIDGQETP
ncbi:helix-turn-helix domain-containing protein [Microbacterium sp. STN6]|uniref:ArsR/SmtB family transcription factor n=1 Tax=Microbacterium sp. STN6 TaxID=2995588 RepID=UPI002260CE1D|nr:helix-turn-helix domain-containing protein [Microbacterium sp. STN6]MCX7522219.1 helix-turn-helix domain-containing protein [Microbacterium sp. STN6]